MQSYEGLGNVHLHTTIPPIAAWSAYGYSLISRHSRESAHYNIVHLLKKYVKIRFPGVRARNPATLFFFSFRPTVPLL